jgi:hypothetical protein
VRVRFTPDIRSAARPSKAPFVGSCGEGFPYGVFYALYPNEAVVIACLHGARSPQVWRRRGAE